jgi:hypothetical protein
MNKKEDLMKHLSGEKTDLKIGQLKNSFILFLLIFSSLSFSQVPVNGFCSLKYYSIPKGYHRLISADLNSDANDELIFYSSVSKRIGIYSGIPGDSTQLKEFQIYSEITHLKQLKDKTGNNNLFAAVERKLRRISLFYISPDSIDAGKSHIEFDSYPENIFLGDVDLNGMEEILVSGTGFDGLSILIRANGGIGERKIISATSFSEAILADVNDDGYPDVIAFNILENSLQFFVNNTNGIFRLSRSIQYPEKISLLRTHDLNKDGLQDIIYSLKNNIEILYGDFQSSFKKKKNFKLDNNPTEIISGDFNRDKMPDLSYILLNGSVSIIFGKKDSEFYESITYLNTSASGSFSKFTSSGEEDIVCFSESGELTIVTTVKELKDEIKITPVLKAGAVKKFDYGNDNIPDIIFIDEFNNYLKLFRSDRNGIPSIFYSFPLADIHKEIRVDDFFKQLKTFYCYVEGMPLIEVFKYNFKDNKLNRKQLYVNGEILDLSLQRVDSSLVNVFVLYNKHSKLYLGKFENRELSITFKEYPFIDRNVSKAKIKIIAETEIYYWKSEADTFYFKMADIEEGPNVLKTYFKIPASKELKINLYGSDNYINQYPTIVSFVQNETDNHIFVISENKFNKSDQLFKNQTERKKEFGRGFFGETSIKGIINFMVISTDDNYINKLVYSEKEKSYLLSRMFVAENLSDYFFARTGKKNYYLVYSNKKGELSISSAKK